MKDAAKKGDVQILHYILKHHQLTAEEKEKFFREIVAIITPHKFSQFVSIPVSVKSTLCLY